MWWTRSRSVVATGSIRVRKAVRVARELETLESRVFLTATLMAPPSHTSTVQHNDVVAPASPTSAMATALSAVGVRLTWTDKATNETGFEILRRKGASGSFTKVATVGANAKAYTDSNLNASTVYNYEILALNGSTASPASNIAVTKTMAVPVAPANLRAAALSPNSVQLNWVDRSSNENGFQILSHIGSSKTWTVVGHVLANITSFVVPGLVPNTPYTYEVMATGAGTTSPASNTASVTTPTLAATVISSTSAQLTWTTAATSYTGFDIQRQVAGAKTWSTVKSVTKTSSQRPHVTGGLPYSFVDNGLLPGVRYNYRIVAKKGQTQTAVSNSSVIATPETVVVPPVTLPAPPATVTTPSNLVATPTSASNIQLTWTDTANDQTGFQIFRDSDNSGNFAFLTTTTSPSYTDFALQSGVSYSYEVLAFNGAVTSASSNQVSAVTLPSAPSALSAVSLTANSIQLSWVPGAGSVTGYTVPARQGGDGQWVTVANLDANTTSFTDVSLPSNTTYSYQVIATNDGELSEASNQALAQTLVAVPGNLAVAAVSLNSVQLSWNSDPSAISGYQIIRQDTDSGEWVVLADLSPSATNFTDSGLESGKAYSYQLVAIDGVTTSTPSNQVTATTLPSAPLNLTATSTATDTIQLTWTAGDGNFQNFEILRIASGGDAWSTLATVPSGSTNYSDTGLQPSTQYSYEVLAVEGGTTSAPSNTAVSTTLPSTPSSAGNLTATDLDGSQIQLTWNDNSSNEAGFKIARSTDGLNFSTVATVAANTNVHGYGSYGLDAVLLHCNRFQLWR